jgi:ABC-type nitrate/sulfonate/bicarbonate transport system permease component
LATAAGLVAVWELAVRTGLADYQSLPAPTAVLASFGPLIASGELPAHLAHTLTVTLAGWVAAAVIGVSFGVLLGLSATAYRYSLTSFEVVRAVPPVALVPAAVLIFGFSVSMELVLVVYAGAWPLLLNTLGGVRAVPAERFDVAAMLRLPRLAAIRKIVLPAALPEIVVGLRLALSMCLVLAVVAEMVGNPEGLGRALVRARQALQPEQMLAYVVTAGVLGVVLNAGFRAAARAVLPTTETGEGAGAG